MPMEMARNCIPYTPFRGRLEESRVCLVSHAGVYIRDEQAPFNLEGDLTSRKIPSGMDSRRLAIAHSHYDHSDADRDVNLVFPIDRLRELVEEKRIKSLTTEFISEGFTQSMREVKERVAWEVANDVHKLRPDFVVLTGGWPLCHRVVVTIQRAIEMLAYPTVLITVDPGQSEQGRPPRALYPAPFTLGHSLGRPHAGALQKQILLDAFDLFLHPVEPGTIVTKTYAWSRSPRNL